MNRAGNAARIARGDGFIAALDQSGGSTPKALRALRRMPTMRGAATPRCSPRSTQMRCRIIRSPAFTGDKVLGAILFEKTMDGAVDGAPVPQALIAKGVVPFLKIDKGLEDEAGGVQLMKPIAGLDALLDRAKALGVFGTKERSVINAADPAGIAAVVGAAVRGRPAGPGARDDADPRAGVFDQGAGPGRGRGHPARARSCEGARHGAGRAAGHAQAVASGRSRTLTRRSSTIRRCSGSWRFPAAIPARTPAPSWRRTAGMIASFSRALLDDLRASASDAEFDDTLGRAIDEIYRASVA